MLDEWGTIKSGMNLLPVDVAAIITRLGILYREEPMPREQSGYFRKQGSFFEIGVNSLESPQRKRFTAAHELGHYVLHRDMLEEGEHFDRLFGAAAKANPAYPFAPLHEIQANRFAADILMPADRVIQDFRQLEDLAGVAARYGVSRRAMRIRLESLGQLVPLD
ncbi:ImmA/IrrE family metallo-endopeptidase [Gellertiella hungarica]|uniref:Zn-dependent peptidase ImmA (M78 family) n=1 Tax=Gellertiella hungarica TaxID=1572859 RepID=A0A7W6NK52_9HYPH|nr:ImmA/IrrE family metallo-endopeptidase [Gellertiella hungarica]MBB4064523.1 Zn-dependent peptidase ImmA (M78 family) [Gellertiella hungarica]